MIQAHAGIFQEFGYPLTVVAGRGDRSGLLGSSGLEILPEMDSRHPLIAGLSGVLSQGQVPVGFDEAARLLADKLAPILADHKKVIVHNILTKHFNLPLTAALHRLVDQGLRGVIAWCHDFTWSSPKSSSQVYPRYPWDLLSRYRPEITYVTVSDARRTELASVLNVQESQIQVIYNGVDEAEILGLGTGGQQIIRNLGLQDADLILLMPVRVTEAKNIEYAINVCAALKEQGVSLRVVLTGPPDPHDEGIMAYYHRLLDLRREKQVQEEFRFVYELETGGLELGPDAVAQLYRFSDALLMPSKREGFGMPVLEAGLAGIPVFCTHFPAADELGGEDIRFIEEDETPQETAQKIIFWMESDHIYHLRQTVRQEYTWRQIFQRDIEPLLLNDET